MTVKVHVMSDVTATTTRGVFCVERLCGCNRPLRIPCLELSCSGRLSPKGAAEIRARPRDLLCCLTDP